MLYLQWTSNAVVNGKRDNGVITANDMAAAKAELHKMYGGSSYTVKRITKKEYETMRMTAAPTRPQTTSPDPALTAAPAVAPVVTVPAVRLTTGLELLKAVNATPSRTVEVPAGKDAWPYIEARLVAGGTAVQARADAQSDVYFVGSLTTDEGETVKTGRGKGSTIIGVKSATFSGPDRKHAARMFNAYCAAAAKGNVSAVFMFKQGELPTIATFGFGI